MSARISYLAALLISLGSFILFSVFSAQGIFGGDSGDLVTAAFLGGVPHPPGYPLYTWLGFILSHLIVGTVSWRVGLLSSLPHAIVPGLVYLLVFRLTRLKIAALFASMALLGNYLFFLYAVTPEVFALLDFFILLLTYLFLRYHQTSKIGYLNWASLVFGLSLAHHQIILFFLPALAYLVWIKKKLLAQNRYSFIRLFVYFGLGLIPYLYFFFAASGKAIVNWDRAVDIQGFVRLISRADYGTFVSGGFYGTFFYSRLLSIKAYFEILMTDLTPVGAVLALGGFWYLFKNQRKIFNFFGLAILFLGPLFFFYASFPLLNRFNIGTYERFLLSSYMFIYLLIGLGLAQFLVLSDRLFKSRMRIWQTYGRIGLIVVLFLYPSTMLGVTSWKFVGLAKDATAVNLGRDILDSLPPQSILLLGRDTPLFITQYVRYAEKVRPDVILLHGSILGLKWYQEVVKKRYPTLVYPASSTPDYTAKFVMTNKDHYSIFTNLEIKTDLGWFWVPWGLVKRLTAEKDLPDMARFYRENAARWQVIHDPTKGVLARYNHLMLADIRDVYAGTRTEFARLLLKGGLTNEAEKELKAALGYDGQSWLPETYTLLGLSELFKKNCDAALNYFREAKQQSLVSDKMLALYEGVTYRDCNSDESKAKTFFAEYERLRRLEETPLH